MKEFSISRRKFLAGSAGFAGACGLVGLSACTAKEDKKDEEASTETQKEIRQVRTICGNCHSNCGVIVTLEDEVVVSIDGDPDHLFNKGAICPKGQSFIDILYSPSRLRTPMKLVGVRGSNEWESITWDEAYDLMASKLTEIADAYGPETLMLATGAPVMNIGMTAFQEFLARYGTPNVVGSGNTCFVPRQVILGSTYGFRDEPDYNNSDLIILWGANPMATNRPGSYSYYETHGACSPVLDAKERGSKVVVIDPVFTETAAKADDWITIRPGTDGALALAMMNVIITENLHDTAFIEKWTEGFEGLKGLVMNCPPSWAAEITQVPEEKIVELARLYATTPRAILHEGNNFALHSNVHHAVQAIACLRGITGHIDAEGCDVCFAGTLGHFKNPFLGTNAGYTTTTKCTTPGVNSKRYPMMSSGFPGAVQAIETGDPYTPRAMIAYHANPLMTQAGYDYNLQALRKLDFVVVVDLFMTTLCVECADLVLPDSCWLERYDYRLYPGSKGLGISLRQPVIEPLHDAKTPHEMEYELATRMGLEADYPWTNGEEFIRYILSSSDITFEQLKENGFTTTGIQETYRKYETGGLRPDGQPGFGTQTGKFMLFNGALKGNGYEPLPVYSEPEGSVVKHPELAVDYPLVGINRRMPGYVHFKYRNNAYLRELHPEPLVQLNPADAAERELESGEWVTATSPTGTAKFKLLISERVMKGTAWFDGGFGSPWDYPESNVNALTNPHDLDPVTQSPDILSFLVQIGK